MSGFAIDALWELLQGVFTWKILVATAEVAWLPVYLLIIRESYRTKRTGMPLLGMCAVLAQCSIYATFGPYWRPDLFPHNPYYGGTFDVVWVWRVWFVVQVITLYQFFQYRDLRSGRYGEWVTSANLVWVVAIVFGLNLIGQWTFISYYDDINVNASDPMAYAFLAVGFVLLAMNRPDHVGLSYPAAWLKLFATAVIYASTFVNPAVSYGSIVAAPVPVAPLQPSGRGTTPPPSTVPPPGTQEFVCTNTAVNPLQDCRILEVICGPSYTILPGPSGPPTCPPVVSTILAKWEVLLSNGWRLARPDSVRSVALGEWDLIHTTASDGRDGRPDPSSWSTIVGCLVAPPTEVAPYWQPQQIPLDSIVSCVDGTVRVQYAFPLFMSIACVACDGLYVGLLWNGRRKRKAAAAGAARS